MTCLGDVGIYKHDISYVSLHCYIGKDLSNLSETTHPNEHAYHQMFVEGVVTLQVDLLASDNVWAHHCGKP